MALPVRRAFLQEQEKMPDRLRGERSRNLWITPPFYWDYIFFEGNRIVIGDRALIAPMYRFTRYFIPPRRTSASARCGMTGVFPFAKPALHR